MEAKVAAPQYLRLLKDRPQSSLIKSRTLSLKANSEIELTSVHEVKIWHVLSGEGLVKQGHEKFRVYSGDTVYHPPLRSLWN
jgi:mannose-6-phosphate isomerase-like protein (cupin superfamily)